MGRISGFGERAESASCQVECRAGQSHAAAGFIGKRSCTGSGCMAGYVWQVHSGHDPEFSGLSVRIHEPCNDAGPGGSVDAGDAYEHGTYPGCDGLSGRSCFQ